MEHGRPITEHRRNPLAPPAVAGSEHRTPQDRGGLRTPPAAVAMTRLAYLVSQYPAVSHTFILRELRRLRALGFDISIASINDPDRAITGLTAEEREEAAATYYVKRAGVVGAARAHFAMIGSHPIAYVRGLRAALTLGGADLRKIAFGLFYFVEAVMVGVWMRRLGVAHLHVHFATPASTVAVIARRMFPITLSITVHGPDEFYDAPGYCLPEKIAAAAFICCIGTYARSQLMKLSPYAQWGKFEVSPLGVDPAVFAPRPARPPGDPFEVICVGRLVPAKGQHILVAAIERLVRAGRSVRVRFVGDGPDREALERDVGARGLGAHVVFEGAVNQDRIRSLYLAADAFALASFAEGIPVVLMEAMAMEIPCVSTFITGVPELIRPGIDGLLVPPSDDGALADALAALMDDPGLCRRLGAAGRQRVLDRYDLDRNTQRLAAIFRRRLEGGAP